MDIELLNEKIGLFKKNRKEDPVVFQNDDLIILKLYHVQRVGSVFQDGERNTTDKVIQRSDYFETVIFSAESLGIIDKYLSFENFTIKKELKEFAELQDIQKKHLSFVEDIPSGYDVNDVVVIDIQKFRNYLDHLSKVKMIKTKTSKIVRDKFNATNTEEVNTAAIFANVGYVVKGFEGKYISLSKGDRTFIKNFMDEQIKAGAYQLTITETLPLYKESIREIIKIGKGLLELTGNKTKLKSFSKSVFGEERKSLESCWQLYFDRYLRLLLMNYKEFYSQFVFKEMKGYDKETRPDFLAVDIYNNIDIIEIKTHRTILFRKEQGRDSYYPSADLNKSIFQLNKYMDLKSENIDTEKIENAYTKALIENDKIYRPRGILIVSSKDHITSEQTDDELTARLEKEIKKLKTTYNNIDIVLFDELIQNLENYVRFLDISLGKKEDLT
ncbi:DUF4263 domain-containing protein [Candidatus Gracilibacteria bacterium]|nr:DUF4263 domain-containing protein [Candidatus Gracilibacteria bacterium]